jgi:S-adenosyl-L-methionine hydrolase (adenosine-forming)
VPIVTLTTDFGAADGYVGAMKGVIHRLAPGTTVVDVAHAVPRHDVAHAAWVLASAAFEFPAGTIHVVVVDPGVGGARAEVIAAFRGHLFVGPDNGVFAHLGACEGSWAITSTAFRQPDPSATFHGRDVFAPTAAALARGLPPDAAGPATCLAGKLPWPRGAVVHVDVYGNLISDVACRAGVRGTVHVAGKALPLVRTYEDVERGELLAYVGSAGTIEIAVRDRDAAQVLGIGRGEPVRFVQ